MSEEKTTIGNFKDFASVLESVTKRASELLESIRQDAEEIDILNDTIDELRSDIQQDAEEIDKLNDIIDELRDENANMQSGFEAMIKRSGLDVSPCRDCGEVVVCIPDGLALCKTCAAKGGEA